VPKREGGRGELVESFTTMTADLLALRDWLQGLGLTQVAMEATGVYWKPVWYLLEDDFELLLCNAGHVKNVPGRKTDVSDAQWLCQLLEHGLLRSSFVPPKPIRELRDLTRYRKTLIRERPREANRLHKVLEDAGIKLACVASDVLGVSGRAMIEALVAGEGDPSVLAELARGRLRAKLPALQRALEGRFSAHHALLCSHILAHLDYLLEVVESLSEEIDKRTRPFARELKQLDTIHRRRQAPSRIDPGRAQPRHEPLPLPSPLRPLGQAQPRQRRVSRQTPLRQDRPRQTPGCARS
jgi:transposase